jgi:hypothetical protein
MQCPCGSALLLQQRNIHQKEQFYIK